MAKFEAHITCRRESATVVQDVAQVTGWTYSVIDGDPLMGQQAYCYLTHYMPDAWQLLDEMREVAARLQDTGAPVLREKIERIVFDSKTGVNELT